MRKNGMIYLYDKGGGLVDARIYSDTYKRKELIKKWRKLYAAKFNDCFLQYAPNVDLRLIGDNGENILRQKAPPMGPNGRFIKVHKVGKQSTKADYKDH